MKNQGGLSIIEVLMVVFMVGVIVSIGFNSYVGWQKQVRLINTKEEIKSVLVRAQQQATSAMGNKSWGIHLATTSYSLFSGDFYDQDNPSNQVWDLQGIEVLSASTTFSNGAGGRGSDVIFYKFTGLTVNTGTIDLLVSSDPNSTTTINVSASGKID